MSETSNTSTRVTALIGLLATLGVVAMVSASPARASSEEAWIQFKKDTRQHCRQALQRSHVLKLGDTTSMHISTMGSDTKGVGVVTVTRGGAARRYVCLMDKRTLQTEIAEIDE
jgi:hypothetical protein